MTEGDALFAAILERPDDDAPRLIYADWLGEQGETERAEFIRVQCEIPLREKTLPQAAYGCDGRRREYKQLTRLRCRERELLRGHDWSIPLSLLIVPHTMRVEFRRGFVAEITLPFAAWLEHRKRLMKAAPLEKVTLTRLPASIMPSYVALPSDTMTLLRGQRYEYWDSNGTGTELSFPNDAERRRIISTTDATI